MTETSERDAAVMASANTIAGMIQFTAQMVQLACDECDTEWTPASEPEEQSE